MPFAPSSMHVESTAFAPNAAIPKRHSAEGEDLSPVLSWRDAPAGTQGFAVICHDPDAPLVKDGSYGYVHWLLYNLAADVTSLEEDTRQGTAGVNDGGAVGYGGPMPPEGHGVHQYYFWVLALDTLTELPEGLTQRELLNELEPHILGMSRLVGTYRRD
ncbi:YbhB/YbcL family Raf kinase inhibitor-like protein [Salinicola endophyticus]|uniref:YbhB/YbcL family Raf kinase inhibitor-like protein n=1 Tax=Salinicola endophyticus TaxID=1949083 RepID=UPI000DA17AEB|nr:YbhB/YbcL family Raf kinase inhibitor-like protein [Salinicola endophyticus]